MSYKQKILLMIRNIMKLNKESRCTLIRKLHPCIAPFPVRIFLLLVSLPLRCQGIPVAAMHVTHHPKYPHPACTFQALLWSGLPLGPVQTRLGPDCNAFWSLWCMSRQHWGPNGVHAGNFGGKRYYQATSPIGSTLLSDSLHFCRCISTSPR